MGGDITCTPCPANTYSKDVGSNRCEKCTFGSYSEKNSFDCKSWMIPMLLSLGGVGLLLLSIWFGYRSYQQYVKTDRVQRRAYRRRRRMGKDLGGDHLRLGLSFRKMDAMWQMDPFGNVAAFRASDEFAKNLSWLKESPFFRPE